MKKRFIIQDIIIETFLGILTILMMVIMLSALILICILPINNYHHATGIVEFKNQYKITSQNEGIITQVFVYNHSHVEQGQAIVQFRSESDSREVGALNVRIKYLEKELITYQNLFQTGAVNKTEVDKKRLELEEVVTRKNDLEKNIVYAPIEGNVYFKQLPEYIKGSFIEKGEMLAFIYNGNEKHIRISFPNTFADRFKIGGMVLFKYKDPISFKVKKMKGIIYKTFINEKDKTVELYCDVIGNKSMLELFQTSTMVSASIIINSTSICQDIFGIDPSPIFNEYVEQNKLYKMMKKLIE